MLSHVLDSCSALDGADKPIVVVGFESQQIRAHFGKSITYVEQTEQLGTGHAVQVAFNALDEESRQTADDCILDDNTVILILYGDVPFVLSSTLNAVIKNASEGALSLLTVTLEDSTGYGRIVRDENGTVLGIVEQKDANVEQLAIKEANTGIMAVQSKTLKNWVNQLSNDNAQDEYYLTDIVGMAVDQSVEIKVSQPDSVDEVLGINDRKQLSLLEGLYRDRQANALMNSGATLVDPKRVDIRGSLTTGHDVCIDVNVLFEGVVELGDDVHIEPHCIIKDSKIASGSRIRAFSYLEGAVVGSGATIGPYARLRENSVIGNNTKIGNFVETKNINLGDGSKASHLTYLGDSEIGGGVNIGAGTITCNYDGKNKHRTQIEDDVFIGSNSALVAPVTIGKGATVAAGAVVKSDVEPGTLAITRSQQRSIKNWSRPDQKTESE